MIPTFEEFLIFLTGTIRTDPDKQTSRINNHWKPIYFNCAPCQERSGLSTPEITLASSYLMFRYDIIMKLETFTRDSQYLKVKIFLSNKTEHFLYCSNSRNSTLMLVLFEGPGHPDTLMKIGKLAVTF